MYKLLILIVPLMLNFNFAQDFELPGLGVYVGGVMGTASGDAVDDLEDLDLEDLEDLDLDEELKKLEKELNAESNDSAEEEE